MYRKSFAVKTAQLMLFVMLMMDDSDAATATHPPDDLETRSYSPPSKHAEPLSTYPFSARPKRAMPSSILATSAVAKLKRKVLLSGASA